MFSTLFHPRVRSGAIALLVLALISAACSGDRPSIEADRRTTPPTPTSFAGLEPAPTEEPTAAPSVDETGDASSEEAPAEDAPRPIFNGGVQILAIEVIEEFPHDPAAFTQGLLVEDGLFLESTGLRFESDLRRVRIDTGEVVQIVSAPEDYFAEGLTKVGDELIQLTWRDEQAIYYDAETFDINRQVQYAGEGWGLCFDGVRLVMSDGSPTLFFRDPASFDVLGSVDVTWNGEEVHNLNELECVAGKVWANIWQSDTIVRINPDTGEVEAAADGATLPLERTDEMDVLNGIAYDASAESFFLTGKLWPTIYRVNFLPATSGGN